MPTALPTPDAHWRCAEIGVPTFLRLTSQGSRLWTRADFGDTAVSRNGVWLGVLDGAWTVGNRSTALQDVYLYDTSYGRRPIPPSGTLRLSRLRSWLLMPSSRGPDEPHVVGVSIQAPPAPLRSAGSDDGQATQIAGEPPAASLRAGLDKARTVLGRSEAADLIGAYARPYFTVSTRPPEPASHGQVAVCVPGDPSRGERLLTRLRCALWGKADKQSPDTLFRLLVRHGLVTHERVAAVRHNRDCGHQADQLNPDAHDRRYRR